MKSIMTTRRACIAGCASMYRGVRSAQKREQAWQLIGASGHDGLWSMPVARPGILLHAPTEVGAKVVSRIHGILERAVITDWRGIAPLT